MRLLICGLLALLAGPASAQNLVLAIGGEPETGYDPLLGWGGYGHPLFQSTLLTRDADLNTRPDLATAWTLSDDRLVWTVTIRDDATFSDGTRLTAADVAFTFTQAKATASALDLTVLQSATAKGDTVTFRLTKPWITFAEYFHTLGIVPAASYGPDYARAPVGSGPYRFVSWAEGEQLIVERNDAYYGDQPAFGRITFLFTPEDTSLAAARAGAVDMVAVPGLMADIPPQGFHAVNIRTVDNRGLSLPFRDNPVTADPAIRKAINLGLDRDLIVDVALNGHGTPAFGPADTLPWAGDDGITFDPAAAKVLLDAAGWAEGPDGIRSKNGIRAAFLVNYPASDSTRQALAETTAELLRPLGIEATPKGGSWDAIGRIMQTQPVIFGFGSHSPYQLYSLYASELAGIGYMNPSRYSNPETDALLAQAQAAPSLEASYPVWSQAAAVYGMEGDNSWAWLVNLDHVYFVTDCLDLGPTQVEPHGHGWPITATLANWQWTCE